MNRLQITVIALSAGLFALLFFGLKTSPSSKKIVEEKRALNATETQIGTLLDESWEGLAESDQAILQVLELQLKEAKEKADRLDLLKQLSGRWYELQQYAAAGHYAQRVAELDESDQTWAMAGTTFALGAQRAQKQKERNFCFDKAVECLENARSLDPSNIDHKLNLALTYVSSPKGNPMQGITMLRQLNEDNPDHDGIWFHLGRLSLQVGKNDLAVERLAKAVSLNPENNKAICLLVQAYRQVGDTRQADSWAEKCTTN